MLVLLPSIRFGGSYEKLFILKNFFMLSPPAIKVRVTIDCSFNLITKNIRNTETWVHMVEYDEDIY